VGQKLRIVLHLTTTKDGLAATLESPDQKAFGLAAAVKRDGSSLAAEIAIIGGKYEGTFAKDYSSIDGTFSQSGGQFPLTLKRGQPDTKKEEPDRPQNPAKP
jgi:hypothetical protein